MDHNGAALMADTSDLDITELEDYANVLRQDAQAGALQFAGITVKYRNLTMQEARRIVPVKTGELKRSIQPKRNEASRLSLNSEWEVTATHAAPIEYGFVHWRSGKFVGPFPYVRPALKKFRRPFIEELATAAKASLSTTKIRSRRLIRNVARFEER